MADVSIIRKQITRTRGSDWCRLEVELKDGRLSICGSAGEIVPKAQARKDAREYWRSFFEEQPEERHAMNDRLGRAFRTAASAARFVVETDGEFHGLDVDKETDRHVYLTHSCGQIVDELRDWFPEVVPFLKWHLNDMRAECEHQEARGETWTTHPKAECPECGYVLGTGWTRRELPAEVVAWVEGLTAEGLAGLTTLTRTGGEK